MNSAVSPCGLVETVSAIAQKFRALRHHQCCGRPNNSGTRPLFSIEVVMAAQVGKDAVCRLYLVESKEKAGKSGLSLSSAGGFDLG